MDKILTGKLISISVIFLILLAIGTHILLTRLNTQNSASPELAPAGAVKVEDDDRVDEVVENVVVYGENGFSPASISLSANRGLGCVINVQNRSAHPLILGMSPHKMPKDPGREYPAIEPGGRLLFDPRFTGFTELKFHDHERPELEFLVKFESSCR